MANSLAHSKWVCKYHVVFSPKYRRKIIYYQLRADIQEYIRDLCKWKGVEIIEGQTIKKYIQDREKADIALDKLSVKEYKDPFSN